jgi:hypothetical protein
VETQQDPDDEPASVLLERIRAQRAQQASTSMSRARNREKPEAASPQKPATRSAPRMLTEAERDLLRRDKAETFRTLQSLRKTRQ